jgi:hypothetical protein
MFRTARGSLLILPLAFLAALAVFLTTFPRAAEAFVPYPFLVEPLGQGLGRRPLPRFAVVSGLVFLLPYLVTSLLLFLSDAGLELAGRLWKRRLKGKAGAVRPLPPESVWTFFGATIVLSVLAARSIDRVAHGGELPGGVNIAPFLVAAIPFAAAAASLALACLVSIPRLVASFWSTQPAPEGPERR